MTVERRLWALALALLVGASIGGVLWRAAIARRAAAVASANQAVEFGAAPDSLDDESGTPSVQAEKAGPGTLQISGTILDTNGLPVANVQAFAELEPPPVDPKAPPAVFTSWRAIAAPSDRDGRFVLTGMLPGKYRVVVRHPDISTAEVRDVIAPQRPTEALRIAVARRVHIIGKVLDGNLGVAKAQVAIRSDALGGMLQTEADTQGRFEFRDLPEGGYQVWAWRGSLATMTTRVLRRGFVPAGEVTLRVEPAHIVVGKIIDSQDGLGVAAAIELVSDNDREAPRYGQSGLDGSFRLEGIPAGRWTLDAYAPGHGKPAPIEFAAGQGALTVELPAGALVTGQVRDRHGQPLAGVTLTVAIRNANGKQEVSARTQAAALARFDGTMIAKPGDAATSQANPSHATTKVPAKAATFEARGELGVLHGPIPPIPPIPPTPGPLTSPSALPTQPALAAAPAKDDIVQARPLRTAMATAQLLPLDPSRSSTFVTDADGRYSIRALPAGDVAVTASLPGYASVTVAAGRVQASEARANVDIVLGAGAPVTGRVVDADRRAITNAVVTIRDDAGNELGRTISGAGGEYQLGPFLGQVTLQASAVGHGTGSRSKVSVTIAVDQLTPVVAPDIELPQAASSARGIVEDETGMALGGAVVSLVVGGQVTTKATTASDGTFMIADVVSGDVTLRIESAGYPPYELTTSSHVAARVRVPLGGGVGGQVASRLTSLPLANVAVAGRGPDGQRAVATTDAQGRFRLTALAAGSWVISVAPRGYAATSVTVDVAKARTPQGLTVDDVKLLVDKPVTLSGVVRDDRGTRLPDVKVTGVIDGQTCSARTNDLGAFTLRGCRAGEVLVTASRGELAVSKTVAVAPGADVADVTLELR